MPFYLCDLAGSGGADDPCRPAIADWLSAWSGIDARVDASRAQGTMVVEAAPSAQESAAIAADPRIALIGDDAARALIAAVLETWR